MNSKKPCPRPEELTRILASGADKAFLAHIECCESCAVEAKSFDQMKEIGKQLLRSSPGPDPERADDMLHALLNEAPELEKGTGRSNRWLGIAVAATVVIVVGIIFLSRLLSTSQVDQDVALQMKRGVVHAHEGARYMLVDQQPDEIIRLTDGTITVEVDRLNDGERFRVVVGDAEVEVLGTTFDVSAEDDRLTAVRVISGEVEVRRIGAEADVLKPGETWQKQEIDLLSTEELRRVEEADGAETVVEEEPRPKKAIDESTLSAKRKQTGSGRESSKNPREASVAEKAFQEGWKALRGGRPKTAVDHFTRSVAEGGRAPIVEDATFWLAVANDRAGFKARAVANLRQFIQRFPASARVGEASVMLGWKLVEQGKHDAARKLFTSCLDNPVASVREGARQGLADMDEK